MSGQWRRTKIICTMGPACEQPELLKRMIEAGMDVARFNTSHGDPQEHAKRIRLVRDVAKRVDATVAILVDLPGPKLRVGVLPEGERKLRTGAEVTLTTGTLVEAGAIPITYPALGEEINPGESIFLADGLVELRVKGINGNRIAAEVVIGGQIRSGAGVNLPASKLSVSLPTEEDQELIRFALKQKAEWLGLSFVQTSDDVRRVRDLLPKQSPPLVMAKIETRQAISNMKSVIQESDGIMVARGDLGVETELAEVPLIQKRLVRLANEAVRPVVIATQMLESMVHEARPTRAEVTDVANAVLDGADAVMLSAETAIGRFPVEAVETLHRVITATEQDYPYGAALSQTASSWVRESEDAISLVACRLSLELNAKAIVVPVNTPEDAARIAQYRPRAPLVALTTSAFVARQIAAIWGVVPLVTKRTDSIEACMAEARPWLLKHQLAVIGEPVVVIRSSSSDQMVNDTLQMTKV